MKKKASSSETKAFQRGDRVEISNKEEGFVGSFYIANIIARISDEDYIVQYRTLMKDDGSAPLREIASSDQIRPLPPEIVAIGFSMSDLVDAYDKDGWWVGEITEILGSNYLVYFENTSEKIAYPFEKLRIHQDWVDGVWVYSKK